MLRPTTPADSELLVSLAAETGVFKPHEIIALQEVLRDYQRAPQPGHACITWEEMGRVSGFAYYAPAAMADGTWYLYWIAVGKAVQGRGIGGRMLAHVEQNVARQAGRMVVIETSSLEHYQPTRDFYLHSGYELEATVRDFYADQDHLVIFRKCLK